MHVDKGHVVRRYGWKVEVFQHDSGTVENYCLDMSQVTHTVYGKIGYASCLSSSRTDIPRKNFLAINDKKRA